jgi:hypothetical protein
MTTEMRDIHFASYVDAIASQVSFPPPAFRLSRLEAFVGTVVAFFDGSPHQGCGPRPGYSGRRLPFPGAAVP